MAKAPASGDTPATAKPAAKPATAKRTPAKAAAAKPAPAKPTAARKPAAKRRANDTALATATKASKDALDSTVKAVKKKPGKAAAIAGGLVAAIAGAAFGASKLAESRKKKAVPEGDAAIDPNSVPDGISVL